MAHDIGTAFAMPIAKNCAKNINNLKLAKDLEVEKVMKHKGTM